MSGEPMCAMCRLFENLPHHHAIFFSVFLLLFLSLTHTHNTYKRAQGAQSMRCCHMRVNLNQKSTKAHKKSGKNLEKLTNARQIFKVKTEEKEFQEKIKI